MSIRKRGEAHKAANGTLNGTANGTIKHDKRVEDARTDRTRWRMKDVRGRQTWHYLESDAELKQWPLTVADRHYLGLETVCNSLIR